MNKAMQFQTVSFYLYFFCIFLSCNSKYFNQGSEPSCDGRCWQDYNPNDACHCNSQCQNFNNCCEDFENLCLTCENRCGLGYDNKYSCQVILNICHITTLSGRTAQRKKMFDHLQSVKSNQENKVIVNKNN